jgi:hypothetical protein
VVRRPGLERAGVSSRQAALLLILLRGSRRAEVEVGEVGEAAAVEWRPLRRE